MSSSVYVVYAIRQQRIHLVSRNVNSHYCVVKSQREILHDLMAEDAALFNQLFNSWTWQQGDDQSGFFDGVPAESILSKVTSGNIRPVIFDFLHPNAGANAAIVPYEHLDLKDTTLETLFRSHPVPTLHDTNFGDLLLTMQHPLVVSIPISVRVHICQN